MGTLFPPTIRTLRARAAVAALLLAVVPAFADDLVAARVQAVIDAIRSGDVPAATTKLGDGADDAEIAKRPELVHVLCDRAYRYDDPKRPAAQRRALADRIHALATTAAALAPADDRLKWALAEAAVLRERAGARSGPAAWIGAAELLQQVHAKKPTDSLPLVYAVSFLLEGASVETEQSSQLCDRADALARTAVEKQKDSPTVAVSVAAAQSWAARTLLPTNRKLAKEQWKAALESLRRPATAKVPILEAATAWNEALTWGRRSGFVPVDRYVMTERTTLDGTLRVSIPVSSRWSFRTVEATADAPAYDYVTQVSDAGRRMRQILFRRYIWGRPYTFEGPNSVGGDNVKSIASGLQAMCGSRVLGAGASMPPPARKPFNRDMDGFVFEIAGRTAAEKGSESEPLRISGYVMRGHDQACYAVLVYDYTGDEEPSPEVEAVLASLATGD